jgi:SOS response associated peptidase (SRAP)
MLDSSRAFYEWKRLNGGKRLYSIQRKDSSLFAFAGLWEAWRAPGSDEWLRTCTVIACEPNELCAQIHNRMPVILPEEYQLAWLSGAAGKEVLTPYPPDLMSAWPIGRRANSPANNDPAILEPAPPARALQPFSKFARFVAIRKSRGVSVVVSEASPNSAIRNPTVRLFCIFLGTLTPVWHLSLHAAVLLAVAKGHNGQGLE